MVPSQVNDWSSRSLESRERQRHRRSLNARPSPGADHDRHPASRKLRHNPRDDGGYREFFAGRKLLKSLDTALALPPPARNRAMARIVLGVEAGIDQERDGDCECMSPDLSALIALMARDGVDDETRRSALELAGALQRLAEHGGLDAHRSADLQGFAVRLLDLPPQR